MEIPELRRSPAPLYMLRSLVASCLEEVFPDHHPVFADASVNVNSNAATIVVIVPVLGLEWPERLLLKAPSTRQPSLRLYIFEGPRNIKVQTRD